jgi:spore coat polysaccharide biosynthesis predicted glycosyltransferase SpsG
MSADHAEGIATVSKSGYPVRVFRSGGLETLIDSIQDFAPSVVINDLPLVEETYLRSLARLGAITINLVDTLDDLERVSRDAQFVISVMNEDRETPEGFYGGPAFAILRRHFQGRERVFRDRPAKVLLTFGGADPQAFTLKVARALAPLTEDLEVISVAGPAFPHTAVFEALQRTIGGRLPLVKGAEVQIADLMLDADLVLCSGGMSVYEIAALGTPGLVLAQNAKEDRRMREFSRFGTIEYLGLGVDVEEARILSAVRQILADADRRRAMSARGRALVDGYGAARAAEIVLEQIQAQGQIESNGNAAKAAVREGKP